MLDPRRGQPPELGRGSALDRLVLFSDAVFAIAITLLAFDLRLPDRVSGYTDAALLAALRDLGPAVFAFLLSFLVTAAFWIGHLRTFQVLVRIDARLVGLDLAFLCWVALLPFPTSIVASEGDLRTGAVFYALFVIVGGLLSASLWIYPTRIAHLASPAVTPDLARRITYRALVVPAVFAASVPVALVNPLAAPAIWILAPIMQAVASRRFGLGQAFEHALGSPTRVTEASSAIDMPQGPPSSDASAPVAGPPQTAGMGAAPPRGAAGRGDRS